MRLQLATARRLNRGLLIFAVIASTAITYVSIHWLFTAKWIQFIHAATNGLVNGTLLANLLQFGIVIGLLLMLLGKARFRDIGLSPQQIAPAILFSILVWIAFHLATIGFDLATSFPLQIRPEFRTLFTATPHIGVLLSQFLGNALYEETFFRGVLLVQLVLWLCPKSTGSEGVGFVDSNSTAQRFRMALAWILSQLVFAFQHIPHRLQNGPMASHLLVDVAVLFLAGLFFAGIFWRTKNLLIAVGLHALVNSPTCLLTGPEWIPVAVVVVIASLLLIFGPRFNSQSLEPADKQLFSEYQPHAGLSNKVGGKNLVDHFDISSSQEA